MINHVAGDDNNAAIFMKNTTDPIFEKHIPNFIVVNGYMDGDDGTPEPQDR